MGQIWSGPAQITTTTNAAVAPIATKTSTVTTASPKLTPATTTATIAAPTRGGSIVTGSAGAAKSSPNKDAPKLTTITTTSVDTSKGLVSFL
jgi:hypothetical protein